MGWTALVVWKLVGLLLLPVFFLHPKLRRHVWRTPHPVPGWTWIHGASAGEHQAARALQTALSRVWRTSSSPRTPVPGAFPAPADLPFIIGPWLDSARPGRLILVESELWPGWLIACRLRGIPVVVVQARPSRGWSRWAATGPVWRWLMHGVDVIPQAEVGDLKLAAPTLPVDRPLPEGAVVLTSSRPGDEARLFDALAAMPRPWPPVVVAPRHLTRCTEVEALATARGLTIARRTGTFGGEDILLLDTFGELASLMSTARVAVVGGTFDASIGGHSPAEAVAAGLVVVAGPHRQANPSAWRAATVLAAGPDENSLAAAIQQARAQPAPPIPSSAVVQRVVERLPAARTPGPRSLRPWLWPIVPLVHALGRLRPAWLGRPVRVSVPVISVGGLTAGGTGKSPMAQWLATRIPGAWVVARGHRRGPGPRVRLGTPSTNPDHFLGDELEMMRRAGVSVVSAPDREAGIRAAIRQGARCVVLDDGFQHRRVHRDLDIVCLDAHWPAGGGPIPVGTGRERWHALQRAHLLVVFGAPTPDRLPPVPIIRATRKLDGFRHCGVHRSIAELPRDIDVALGLARPAHLLSELVARGHTIRSLQLSADHRSPSGVPVGCVVTEKDAARLPDSTHLRVLTTSLYFDQPSILADLLASVGVQLAADAR